MPDNLIISNMKTYIHDQMNSDIESFISSGKLKSGYSNLDCITNIYPGLYVLGAISSLGKTTFIHQMSDQMAAAGQKVIYFSLEQSTLELASKSLSRIMAKHDFRSAKTSLQIRKSMNDERVEGAKAEYSQYSGNLTIVECSFNSTILDIENFVTDFIGETKEKPVVIIDYLQVIQPMDPHMTTKDVVDSHVRRLKQLQSDNKIALIVISSLNRQNYLTQIDYESFKESGGIEYTADVIWGLQLEALHDELFDKQSKLNEKRQKIRDAKAANPRKIELVCLKNRFGISSYCCHFDYYPQFDYFIANDYYSENVNIESDPDGLITLPDGYDLPFK